MKFAFFVNDIETEDHRYTTTLLAHTAQTRGNDVYYITTDDFIYRPDGRIEVKGRSTGGAGKSPEEYLEHLQSEAVNVESLDVADLDVLMLRSDPAVDAREQPWAQTVGIIFGREAARRGVLVLNDPSGLAKASNKFYFQRFPEEVRPKTLICRDQEEIKSFIEQQRGKVILKPLQGSGGQSVFLVRKDEDANVNQMIDAVSRDGYVIAQEFLPAAERGDLRLFLINGQPLKVDGHYAALRREHSDDDLRSNLTAGGKIGTAEVDETALRVAAIVAPRLIADGMFFVGLDIAGDKLLEINVFSPGGINACQQTEKVDFVQAILDAIEHKIEVAKHAPGVFDNRRLAVL